MDSILRKNIFLFLALGGFILVSDQLSKILIRLNGGFYICNPHIAFNLKIPEFLFGILWTIIICLLIYAYRRGLLHNILYLTLILSGAMANMLDRFWWGCVIDFIDLGFWPVFNLADSFITLGAIMLIITYLKAKR